ncbi:MAG: YfiR family protein [Phycisphaeraceae bacterium]
MFGFITRQHSLRQLAAHLGVLVVIVMLSGASTAVAENEAERLAKVKAAFTYNFVKFVEWPGDAFPEDASPVVILVIGTEQMHRTLQRTVANKRVHGRALEVARLPMPTLDDRDRERRRQAIDELVERIGASHLVYFEPDEHEAIAEILARSDIPRHVLTVGDGAAFVGTPTMLDLVMSDGRMTFYANRERIESSRIRISSKLLRLARQKK